MIEQLEMYFEWPIFPFSVLLIMVAMYWLMVIFGGLDLDGFDIDLDLDMDLDVDADMSISGWGLVGLKWLNIGEVPLMVWLSAVAFASWTITMILDRGVTDLTNQQIILAIGRTFGLGVLAAKFMTNPLRGIMRIKEPNTIKDLVGQTCQVVTSEVNEKFGIAVCEVEGGAPLRLNVRTIRGSVPKETIVEILDYSEESGCYYVQAVEN